MISIAMCKTNAADGDVHEARVKAANGVRISLITSDSPDDTRTTDAVVDLQGLPTKTKDSEDPENDYEDDDPPDGGWGWVVVMAVHLSLLLSQGSLTGFGPFIIRLQQYFESGAGEVAGISGTALFVTLATGPIASALNSWLGCRAVVVIGGVVSTVGHFTSSMANQLSHLYITCGVIVGIGFGLVATPSIAFIARYFKKRYALANGLVFAGFAIGWIALPQLYQVLINRFGWRNSMVCLAAMDLHICVCGALFRPPRLTNRVVTLRARSDKNKDAANIDLAPYCELTSDISLNSRMHDIGQRNRKLDITKWQEAKPRKTTMSTFSINKTHSNKRATDVKCLQAISKFIDVSLFCHPLFVLMAVAYFIIAVGFYPTILFLVARAESFGIPYPLPTTLMTITGAVSLFGRAGHGHLVDIGLVTPIRALAGSVFICGAVNLASAMVQKYVGLAVLYAIFGLANGVYHPMLAVTLKDFVGTRRLTGALGFCNLCHGLGALIGPPITGRILDLTGSYNYCYFFTGSLLCLSAVMLMVTPPLITKCQRRRQTTRTAGETKDPPASDDLPTVFQFVTVV